MPTVKLTATACERLKAPTAGRIEYFDKSYPALALRITSNNIRSWVYFGRLHGRLRRITLGRFPAVSLKEARKRAGEVADKLREGEDVTQSCRDARRETERDTFELVLSAWLKRDQAQNRSASAVERAVRRNVLPQWAGRPIETITRRDCIELLDGIVDRGSPTMARRVHAHLHRLFQWAVGRGIVDRNPTAGLDKPGAETKRDRVLSDNELRDVWCAAGSLGFPFGSAYRLLILTGCRRDEIGSLAWNELDLERAEIRLAGARTKNRQSHTIPLSAPALEILRGVPRIEDKHGLARLVFPACGTTSSNWARAKVRLDAEIVRLRREAAQVDGRDCGSADMLAPWRTHDLRRTIATNLQRLGCRLETIESVLGHVGGSRAGIVGTYQRYSFTGEARQALDRWARHLMWFAEGGADAKVVQLHPAERA